MNKLFSFILVIIVALFFGCQNEIVEKNEEENVWVENGILNFKTGDDFFSFSEKLSAMSRDESIEWENKLGFFSLRSEIEKVSSQIDSCKTVEDFHVVLENNSDILKLEDNTVVPVINSIFYPKIVNREGYYIVNGVLHRVTEDGIYTSTEQSFDDIEYSSRGRIKEDTESVRFMPHKTSMLKSGNCGSIQNEESVWNNGKQCFVKVFVERKYCLSDCCTHEWNYAVSCYTEARKKFLGATILYKSGHFCHSVELVMDAPVNSDHSASTSTFSWGTLTETLSEIDYTDEPYEMKVRYWWDAKGIGDVVKQWDPNGTPSPLIPDPVITRVKAEFHTNGSYPYTAKIDCGYGY